MASSGSYPQTRKGRNRMQPTERIERVELAPTRSTGIGPVLAHGAAMLLRATAIAVLAAPLVLGIVLLLR